MVTPVSQKPAFVNSQRNTPGLASTQMQQMSSIDDGYDSDTMNKFRKDVEKQMATIKKECIK